MNFLKRGLLISLSTAMVAVLLLLLRASPTSAQTCAQDLFTAAGNSQTLNCSAKDIVITGASNPRNLDGSSLNTCVTGQPFNLLVDFTVVSQSDKTRSNVGLYIGTIPVGQAGSSALSGSCTDNIMADLHLKGTGTSCTAGTSTCLGDANYSELDGTTSDNCGDAATKSTHTVTVELDGVVCPKVGATSTTLPDCTTWQVPGSTLTCFSQPGSGWPFVPSAAIPGSPSKCHCGQVSIPITPISPSISEKKSVTPASIVEPGGVFHYTAVTTNTTPGPLDVTINQLCDDKFGNIATATTSPAQNPCAAGSLCSAPNNVAGSTCATNIKCSLPATIAQNAAVTCTFDGTVTGTEPLTVKDTVTANGVGGGAVVSAHDSISVSIGEAAAKAQLIKSLDGARECATARYKVEVDNLSAAGTDETEALTKLLDDKFGDITALGVAGANPTVVGTTCGVASGSAGLGTLSGATGAGALGTSIAVGGNYTCEFDGQFCAALSSVGGCTTGLENKDTVTATLTQEDGFCSGGPTPGALCTKDADCGTGGTCPLTFTAVGSLTVDSCFSHTP